MQTATVTSVEIVDGRLVVGVTFGDNTQGKFSYPFGFKKAQIEAHIKSVLRLKALIAADEITAGTEITLEA